MKRAASALHPDEATIAEIARAAHRHERNIERRAARERWAYREERVRGGARRLYPLTALPEDVRTRVLLARARSTHGSATAPQGAGHPPGAASSSAPGGVFVPRETPEALWAWYARRPGAAQAEAQRRLPAVQAVRQMVGDGVPVRRAIHASAAAHGLPEATLRRWWYGEGRLPGARRLAPQDALAALAPRRPGRLARIELPQEMWDLLRADWLRPERPTLQSCYRRAAQLAAARGWRLPSYATVARRIRALPWSVRVLAREGLEALTRRLPQVTRTRTHLGALEAVNADGHTFDLMVRLPSGAVGRPVMVAWQDIASGKLLAWRCAETLSSHLVRLAFGDLIERYGVPEHAYLDNGREFASKWMTGGAPTRYRFTIREDDPLGLLTQLGVTVHWTTPYHGQAKPIERAFRDLCDEIARHPAAAGAYTGHAPTAKPENYGSRALEWEAFLRLVDEGIRAHNARPGRRTETARGRSFDATFHESFARAVVRRPSPEQRRLWLLAAEGVTVRETGHVAIAGNLYWGEALAAHIGRRVVVRFDPDALDRPVHVYAPDGVYLGEAARTVARFDDLAAARAHARANRARIRAAREALAAERRMAAIEALRTLPAAPPAAEAQPAAVRLMPDRTARRRVEADEPSRHVSAQERAVLALLDAWARDKRIVGM